MNYAVQRNHKLFGSMQNNPQASLDAATIKVLQQSVFQDLYASDLERFYLLGVTGFEGLPQSQYFDFSDNTVPATLQDGGSPVSLPDGDPRFVRNGFQFGTSFDGNDQAVDLSTGLAFADTDEWTVTVSFITTQAGDNGDFGFALVGRDNSDITAQITVRNGFLEFAHKDGASWVHTARSTTLVNDGLPHTATLVSSGGTLVIYIDGNPVPEFDSSISYSGTFNLDQLMLGFANAYTQGSVFALLVYSGAKDALFAEALHNFLTSGGTNASAGGPPVVVVADQVESQMMWVGSSFSPPVDENSYQVMNGSGWAWIQNPLLAAIPWPTSGVVRNIAIELTADPGATAADGFRFEMRNHTQSWRGAPIDLTGSERTGKSYSGLDVRPGNLIHVRCKPLGNPNASIGSFMMTYEFVPDDPSERVILCKSFPSSGGPPNDALSYLYPARTVGSATYTTTETSRAALFSRGGKLKKMHYFRDSTIPGVGKSWNYSYFNITQSAKLTTVLGGTNTQSANTVDEIDVRPGDEVTIENDPVGTPGLRHGAYSCVFVPDSGTSDAPLLGGSTVGMNPANLGGAPRYMYPSSLGSTSWRSAREDRCILINERKKFKGFSVIGNRVQDAGESWIVEIQRKASGSSVWLPTLFTGVIDDATASFTVNAELSVHPGDALVLCAVPSNPAGANLRLKTWSLSQSNDDADPTTPRVTMLLIRGGTTHEGFKVHGEVVQARTGYGLVVATDAAFANVVFESAQAAALELDFDETTRYIVQHEATGLSADTDYWYAIKSLGKIDIENAGFAHTFPAPGVEPASAVTHKIGCISCMRQTLMTPPWEYPALEALAKENCLSVVHLGDFVYHDIGTDDLPLIRSALRDMIKQPDVQIFLRGTDLRYMHDDHDGGPNDHTAETANAAIFMPANIQVINEWFPNGGLAQPAGVGWTRGLAQKWDLGRAVFVMPDLFFQKSPSASEMMGGTGTLDLDVGTVAAWDQRSWVQSTLASAQANGAMIAFFCSTQRMLAISGNGWQDGYESSLRALFRDFVTGDYPMIFGLEGDAHRTGYDDGKIGSKPWLLDHMDGQIPLAACSCVKSNPGSGLNNAEWNGDFNLSAFLVSAANGLQWTASPAYPNEYYVEKLGGGEPYLDNIGVVSDSTGNVLKSDPGAALAAGRWKYGNEDGLSYKTLYYRSASGAHPDTMGVGVVYVEQYTIIEINDKGSGISGGVSPFNVSFQNKGRTGISLLDRTFALEDRVPLMWWESTSLFVSEDAGAVDVILRREWIGCWGGVVVTMNGGGTTAGIDYTDVSGGLVPGVHGNTGNSQKAVFTVPILNRNGAAMNGRTFFVWLMMTAKGAITTGGTMVTVSIMNV